MKVAGAVNDRNAVSDDANMTARRCVWRGRLFGTFSELTGTYRTEVKEAVQKL
jgi:hypothetical protein